MKKVLVGSLLLIAVAAVGYYAYFHTDLFVRRLSERQVAGLVQLVGQKRTAEFRAVQRTSCNPAVRSAADDPQQLIKLENVTIQEMIRQSSDGSYIITLSADHVPSSQAFKTIRRSLQIHGIPVENGVSLLGYKYLDDTGDFIDLVTETVKFSLKYQC